MKGRGTEGRKKGEADDCNTTDRQYEPKKKKNIEIITEGSWYSYKFYY